MTLPSHMVETTIGGVGVLLNLQTGEVFHPAYQGAIPQGIVDSGNLEQFLNSPATAGSAGDEGDWNISGQEAVRSEFLSADPDFSDVGFGVDSLISGPVGDQVFADLTAERSSMGLPDLTSEQLGDLLLPTTTTDFGAEAAAEEAAEQEERDQQLDQDVEAFEDLTGLTTEMANEGFGPEPYDSGAEEEQPAYTGPKAGFPSDLHESGQSNLNYYLGGDNTQNIDRMVADELNPSMMRELYEEAEWQNFSADPLGIQDAKYPNAEFSTETAGDRYLLNQKYVGATQDDSGVWNTSSRNIAEQHLIDQGAGSVLYDSDLMDNNGGEPWVTESRYDPTRRTGGGGSTAMNVASSILGPMIQNKIGQHIDPETRRNLNLGGKLYGAIDKTLDPDNLAGAGTTFDPTQIPGQSVNTDTSTTTSPFSDFVQGILADPLYDPAEYGLEEGASNEQIQAAIEAGPIDIADLFEAEDETPVVEAPVVTPPVVDAPVVVETPVVEAPVVETPVVETPVVEDTDISEVFEEVETPVVVTPDVTDDTVITDDAVITDDSVDISDLMDTDVTGDAVVTPDVTVDPIVITDDTLPPGEVDITDLMDTDIDTTGADGGQTDTAGTDATEINTSVDTTGVGDGGQVIVPTEVVIPADVSGDTDGTNDVISDITGDTGNTTVNTGDTDVLGTDTDITDLLDPDPVDTTGVGDGGEVIVPDEVVIPAVVDDTDVIPPVTEPPVVVDTSGTGDGGGDIIGDDPTGGVVIDDGGNINTDIDPDTLGGGTDDGIFGDPTGDGGGGDGTGDGGVSDEPYGDGPGFDWGDLTDPDMWKDLFGGSSSASGGQGGAGGIGGTIIQYLGNKEGSDAMADAAKDAIKLNKELMAQIRDDLEPYRDIGQGAIDAGVLDSAISTPTTEGLPDLYAGRQDIDPLSSASSGVSNQDTLNSVFGGLEGLPDMVADTGAVGGLIERGNEEWDVLVEDALRAARDPLAARGKYISGTGADQSIQALLRGMGQIEGINTARSNRELARRQSDFGISSGARGQLTGEQFGEAQMEFNQLSDARDQLFKEAFGTEQADIANTMNLEQQRMGQDSQIRNQLLNELMGLDQMDFDQLLQMLAMGQNSAAQTGAGYPQFGANMSDMLGTIGAVEGRATNEKYGSIGDILSGIFA